MAFRLFYPKFDDFNKRMLRNINCFKFENKFVGEKSFVKRAISELLKLEDVVYNKI